MISALDGAVTSIVISKLSSILFSLAKFIDVVATPVVKSINGLVYITTP